MLEGSREGADSGETGSLSTREERKGEGNCEAVMDNVNPPSSAHEGGVHEVSSISSYDAYKDRSKSLPVSFRHSTLETIHSEETTPRSSASQEELLASLLAMKEQLPPNPGLVFPSTKPEGGHDSRIEIKPTLEVAVQDPHKKNGKGVPFPSQLAFADRRGNSLPHYSQQTKQYERPASGDYDRHVALFEDIMGTPSEPSFSQTLPQEGSNMTPTLSRAVKTALLGKVDFGHAFSQTQPDSSPDLDSSGWSKEKRDSYMSALANTHGFYGVESGLPAVPVEDVFLTPQAGFDRAECGLPTVPVEEEFQTPQVEFYGVESGLPSVPAEDEFQTPQASPMMQRRQYSQPQANSGSTQETVTPQASPSEIRRTIVEESSPDHLPLPEAPPDIRSSFTSSTASETTIIPRPLESVVEAPPSSESNAASISPCSSSIDRPRETPEKLEVDMKSDSSPSSSKRDKDKGKNQESSSSSSSIFKPFSVVRRVHSFSQTRRKQRPISVIGLVHTTRDNSDLLDLDAAMRLKRMTGERQSPILTGRDSPILLGRRRLGGGGGGSGEGSPVVPEENVPSLTKVSLTPPTRPRRSISLRDTALNHQPMDEEGSPDGASSPDLLPPSSSATNRSPRNNRWSLLRSKNHKQKLPIAEEKLDEEVVTHQGSPLPPGSDDKEVAVVEEKHQFKEAPAKFEPQQADSPTEREERGAEGGSLFCKPEEVSKDVRHRVRNRKKRDERCLTIIGTENELASLEQQQQSTEQHSSKVFKLAREYSRKIKARRMQQKSSPTAATGIHQEEDKQQEDNTGYSLSLSQTHLSTFDEDGSQTPPTSSSPEWLREHRSSHHIQPSSSPSASKALSTTDLASKAFSTTDLADVEGSRLDSPLAAYSDSERTDTPLGISDQTKYMRKEGLPSSIPELPRSNNSHQKSFTIARFTSVADEMMMQGREVEERRRGRFGGWVRSLVTRFSGSGK